MQIQSEIFNDPKLAEHTISNFLDRKREDSNIKPFPNKEEWGKAHKAIRNYYKNKHQRTWYNEY